MNKIDVSLIAEKVSKELNEEYLKDIRQMIVKSKDKDTEDEKMVELLNGLALSLKNHSERFTISVVQQAIDQLHSEK